MTSGGGNSPFTFSFSKISSFENNPLGSRVILVSKTLVVATFEVCIQLTVGRLPRVVLFGFVGVTTCLFQSDFFPLIVRRDCDLGGARSGEVVTRKETSVEFKDLCCSQAMGAFVIMQIRNKSMCSRFGKRVHCQRHY